MESTEGQLPIAHALFLSEHVLSTVEMQNESGEVVDTYIPRKWYVEVTIVWYS